MKKNNSNNTHTANNIKMTEYKKELMQYLDSGLDLLVFNDAQLQVVLGESKRSLAYIRQRGEIAYIQKKPRGKIQYFPSDVKAYLLKYRKL